MMSSAARTCVRGGRSRKRLLPTARNFFSNPCSTNNSMLLDQAVIHRIGKDGAYGIREYVLVPGEIPLSLVEKDPKLKLASLRANKNVIFGARVHTINIGGITDVCGGLVDVALEYASAQGEQPQGLASLDGLHDWVARGIQGKENIPLLDTMRKGDTTLYEAVEAIATSVSRKGHSVVGVGTLRDGEHGWTELAKEFVNLKLGEEATLYQAKGGELVSLEPLADQSESFIKSAGGAMARFFFV